MVLSLIETTKPNINSELALRKRLDPNSKIQNKDEIIS
jgi:hypothetical protein